MYARNINTPLINTGVNEIHAQLVDDKLFLYSNLIDPAIAEKCCERPTIWVARDLATWYDTVHQALQNFLNQKLDADSVSALIYSELKQRTTVEMQFFALDCNCEKHTCFFSFSPTHTLNGIPWFNAAACKYEKAPWDDPDVLEHVCDDLIVFLLEAREFLTNAIGESDIVYEKDS